MEICFGQFMLTVLTGVMVFVLSQWAQAVFLSPAIHLRRVVGKVSYELEYSARAIGNSLIEGNGPEEFRLQSETALRGLACELREAASAVTCYELAKRLKLFRVTKENVTNASYQLILLSNEICTPLTDHSDRAGEVAHKVKELLGIKDISDSAKSEPTQNQVKS